MFRTLTEKMHVLFANCLQAKIEDGSLPRGCKMPSIGELTKAFSVEPADAVLAMMELENRKLVRFEAREVKTLVGSGSGEARPVDPAADIERLFKQFSELENNALDLAWPRIDKESFREVLRREQDVSPTRRIWLINMRMHLQIAGNCGDAKLCGKLEALHSRIAFFKRLHLPKLPAEEAMEHALAGEAIVFAVCDGDLEGAHRNLSSYLEKLKGALIEKSEKARLKLKKAGRHS